MLFGTVDEVDGQYIATEFLGMLLPTRSMFITSASAERHGNTTTFRYSGVPVRLNLKSIALAYLRVWPPVLGCAWPFVMHWGQNVSHTPASTWFTALGLILVSFVSLLPGRLSEREKVRLRALGTATGLKLDPARLTGLERYDRLGRLTHTMTQAGLPTTPDALMGAAETAPASELPLLYAFASYSEGPAWQVAAQAVLARIEQRA